MKEGKFGARLELDIHQAQELEHTLERALHRVEIDGGSLALPELVDLGAGHEQRELHVFLHARLQARVLLDLLFGFTEYTPGLEETKVLAGRARSSYAQCLRAGRAKGWASARSSQWSRDWRSRPPPRFPPGAEYLAQSFGAREAVVERLMEAQVAQVPANAANLEIARAAALDGFCLPHSAERQLAVQMLEAPDAADFLDEVDRLFQVFTPARDLRVHHALLTGCRLAGNLQSAQDLDHQLKIGRLAEGLEQVGHAQANLREQA